MTLGFTNDLSAEKKEEFAQQKGDDLYVCYSKVEMKIR